MKWNITADRPVYLQLIEQLEQMCIRDRLHTNEVQTADSLVRLTAAVTVRADSAIIFYSATGGQK